MKLVVDLRLIHNSGIGTYIKNVLPSLIDHFDKVYAIGVPEVIDSFDWSKKLHIIRFDAKVYSLKEQILYPFKIPKCDVLWIPHFNAPIYNVKSKKMVVTIHDVNHLSNPTNFSFLKRLWAKILYRNSAKNSEMIFTVSEFSKSEILTFFNINKEKIKVVYGGINLNFVKNSACSVKLNLPDNYFLFVGNVKKHKNLITLLKAYNQLNSEIKSKYKIVILGRKEGFITQDNEIFKYIKKTKLEESIHFTGYLEDDLIPKVYVNASIFIFPSLYEGFGLPLLEAMVCKIPVLSSDRASLKEVGGDAVMYFDPTNAIDLKNKLEQLLLDSDVIMNLVSKGLEQIKLFDWKYSIERHVNYFKEL
ncbi:glycosyltransferase family 1 protein [uncultured Aquimarina sp.]|uniref:glycosyltransferase family 4 protein n=1 Tax=uncultured Aquimarina sp. TaxID=575652 RepID=UPI002608B524|nr:glycosyltransferase family 1 protein [uncultured Aquimarina sp.]